jgi:hypothetical protein
MKSYDLRVLKCVEALLEAANPHSDTTDSSAVESGFLSTLRWPRSTALDECSSGVELELKNKINTDRVKT